MGRRYELSDVEWEALSRYLPCSDGWSASGRRPASAQRDCVEDPGRAAWRDVPARYGSWQSIYTRFRGWALDGTFERMLAGVQADADAAGDIDWLVLVARPSCVPTSTRRR
ncbi:transposase [Micromonospora gifhornensis]|uniref:transposase n=1 Tax=Micromonospora gifhornensis TaxID=84594 RepID=UPI003D72BD01